MTDHDDLDEPCALDYDDAPGYFHPRPQPPAGLTWWQGWWPSYGINSLDDLRLWVETRLDEMISLQSSDSLADLGRLLGVQALKNADRYLGLFGKGDHPPRPSDDKLQRVEDVEDALEAVVRYLRQQSQPAGTSTPPPALSAPSSGSGSPPRSWTQPDLDAAIYKYVAERGASYKSLREAVESNQKGAVESARKLFGRNVVAAALGVKSRAMVTKSPAWRDVASALRLGADGLRRLNPSMTTGYGYALDEKAATSGDPVADEVERRDAIRFVRKKLKKGEEADAIVAGLENGDISPEQAEEMVKLVLDDRDDTRPRRPAR